MSVTTFILAWILATIAMSSFSAQWSILTGRQFREHILLSHILTKGSMHSLTMRQWVIGWVVHVIFGAVFVASYEVLWHFTGIARSLRWSLIFGAFIGMVGIIGWILMFSLSKNPPKINYTHYYIHLFFAHLVFSLAAYLVYNFMN